MSGTEIAIGSRGSALALAQANLVRDALAGAGLASRIVVVETEGDRRQPDTAWGEGAFVAAIERALLDGEVDIAVHSAKDIPTQTDGALVIAAYLPRADPRDALVVRPDAAERSLDALARGARVGTDSPRRTGFVLARRPDLTLHPLNGNVDTRLRRLDAGETDALVLACAGLDRLGLGARIAERFEAAILPPAPGQGAIAVQVRRDDGRTREWAVAIDDVATRQAVDAERSFLEASGGGCRAPLGALARVEGGTLEILGGSVSPDGTGASFARRRGPVEAGVSLGQALATELARAGATAAGAATPADAGEGPGRVIVTRASEQAGELASALRACGLEPVLVPAIAVELQPSVELDDAARVLPSYAWVVVTSLNGARAILAAAERVLTPFEAARFAAIGRSTRRALEREGVDVDFVPSRSAASAIAAELTVRAGDRVLIVRGDLAGPDLAEALRTREADVDDVIGYRTVEAPAPSRDRLRAAMQAGPIRAVIFTSGSTVRGLCALGERESIDVRAIPAVCIGPETATEARSAGFRVLAVSAARDATALAAATAEALQLQPVETA